MNNIRKNFWMCVTFSFSEETTRVLWRKFGSRHFVILWRKNSILRRKISMCVKLSYLYERIQPSMTIWVCVNLSYSEENFDVRKKFGCAYTCHTLRTQCKFRKKFQCTSICLFWRKKTTFTQKCDVRRLVILWGNNLIFEKSFIIHNSKQYRSCACVLSSHYNFLQK